MTFELATCKINENNNNLFTFSTIFPGPSWVSLMPRVGYVVVGDPKKYFDVYINKNVLFEDQTSRGNEKASWRGFA